MAKRRLIKFRRKTGRKVRFYRKKRKLKKPYRLKVSRKVYKRKVLRDPFGRYAGSRRSR